MTILRDDEGLPVPVDSSGQPISTPQSLASPQETVLRDAEGLPVPVDPEGLPIPQSAPYLKLSRQLQQAAGPAPVNYTVPRAPTPATPEQVEAAKAVLRQTGANMVDGVVDSAIKALTGESVSEAVANTSKYETMEERVARTEYERMAGIQSSGATAPLPRGKLANLDHPIETAGADVVGSAILDRARAFSSVIWNHGAATGLYDMARFPVALIMLAPQLAGAGLMTASEADRAAFGQYLQRAGLGALVKKQQNVVGLGGKAQVAERTDEQTVIPFLSSVRFHKTYIPAADWARNVAENGDAGALVEKPVPIFNLNDLAGYPEFAHDNPARNRNLAALAQAYHDWDARPNRPNTNPITYYETLGKDIFMGIAHDVGQFATSPLESMATNPFKATIGGLMLVDGLNFALHSTREVAATAGMETAAKGIGKAEGVVHTVRTAIGPVNVVKAMGNGVRNVILNHFGSKFVPFSAEEAGEVATRLRYYERSLVQEQQQFAADKAQAMADIETASKAGQHADVIMHQNMWERQSAARLHQLNQLEDATETLRAQVSKGGRYEPTQWMSNTVNHVLLDWMSHPESVIARRYGREPVMDARDMDAKMAVDVQTNTIQTTNDIVKRIQDIALDEMRQAKGVTGDALTAPMKFRERWVVGTAVHQVLSEIGAKLRDVQFGVPLKGELDAMTNYLDRLELRLNERASGVPMSKEAVDALDAETAVIWSSLTDELRGAIRPQVRSVMRSLADAMEAPTKAVVAARVALMQRAATSSFAGDLERAARLLRDPQYVDAFIEQGDRASALAISDELLDYIHNTPKNLSLLEFLANKRTAAGVKLERLLDRAAKHAEMMGGTAAAETKRIVGTTMSRFKAFESDEAFVEHFRGELRDALGDMQGETAGGVAGRWETTLDAAKTAADRSVDAVEAAYARLNLPGTFSPFAYYRSMQERFAAFARTHPSNSWYRNAAEASLEIQAKGMAALANPNLPIHFWPETVIGDALRHDVLTAPYVRASRAGGFDVLPDHPFADELTMLLGKNRTESNFGMRFQKPIAAELAGMTSTDPVVQKVLDRLIPHSAVLELLDGKRAILTQLFDELWKSGDLRDPMHLSRVTQYLPWLNKEYHAQGYAAYRASAARSVLDGTEASDRLHTSHGQAAAQGAITDVVQMFDNSIESLTHRLYTRDFHTKMASFLLQKGFGFTGELSSDGLTFTADAAVDRLPGTLWRRPASSEIGRAVETSPTFGKEYGHEAYFIGPDAKTWVKLPDSSNWGLLRGMMVPSDFAEYVGAATPYRIWQTAKAVSGGGALSRAYTSWKWVHTVGQITTTLGNFFSNKFTMALFPGGRAAMNPAVWLEALDLLKQHRAGNITINGVTNPASELMARGAGNDMISGELGTPITNDALEMAKTLRAGMLWEKMADKGTFGRTVARLGDCGQRAKYTMSDLYQVTESVDKIAMGLAFMRDFKKTAATVDAYAARLKGVDPEVAQEAVADVIAYGRDSRYFDPLMEQLGAKSGAAKTTELWRLTHAEGVGRTMANLKWADHNAEVAGQLLKEALKDPARAWDAAAQLGSRVMHDYGKVAGLVTRIRRTPLLGAVLWNPFITWSAKQSLLMTEWAFANPVKTAAMTSAAQAWLNYEAQNNGVVSPEEFKRVWYQIPASSRASLAPMGVNPDVSKETRRTGGWGIRTVDLRRVSPNSWAAGSPDYNPFERGHVMPPFAYLWENAPMTGAIMRQAQITAQYKGYNERMGRGQFYRDMASIMLPYQLSGGLFSMADAIKGVPTGHMGAVRTVPEQLLRMVVPVTASTFPATLIQQKFNSIGQSVGGALQSAMKNQIINAALAGDTATATKLVGQATEAGMQDFLPFLERLVRYQSGNPQFTLPKETLERFDAAP